MTTSPKTITITAAGTSQAVPLDVYNYGYGIGITVATSASGTSYTLQHTFTNPGSTNLNLAGAGVWMNHDDSVAVNASANISTNYSFSPRATRIVVSALASGATMTWTLVPTGDTV